MVHNSDTNSNLRWVWKLKGHIKQKTFIWTCLRNALPCRSILQQRGIPISPLCPFCSNHNETLIHLFLECEFSKQVWLKAGSNIQIQYYRDFDSWIKANATCKDISTLNIPRGTVFIYLLWHIWNSRNNLIFNLVTVKPEQVAYKGLAAAAEFWHLTNSSKSISQLKDNVHVNWSPPKEGWTKLNTDGACSGNPGVFSVGGILRNSNGNWTHSFSGTVGSGSALEAKLWAIYLGLNLAKDTQCKFIWIESDSLLAGFTEFSITHTCREGNMCADKLAKQALLDRSGLTFHQQTPSHIKLNILADQLGVLEVRTIPML
ncbi:putative ribonuclease H-like domain, reverse transcriptase zinc-binding domain-containing protein [Senna tora]|uniref:Putative ribonuclease H-like domain, reverse transcriptase zinc-binding domain-containing protein n=1 Tax=Senna tora TaxID=362788 RepID=A0A834SUP7_9FABA|nr:putative ribonuclease H-like domain, reverse transcriptase zinc-binding domain-containing protein [Senna tora]